MTLDIKTLNEDFKERDAKATARLTAQFADDAEAAAKAAQAAANPPPDPREAPHFELLQAQAPASLLARINPRRSRWPELQAIDRRIAELDVTQTASLGELEALQSRRRTSDQDHQARLADWFGSGQQGPRPASDAVELDARIADLRADIAAVDLNRDRLYEERVAFVAKHRKRLAAEAQSEREKRYARCVALIDELEQQRDELQAARATEIWTQLYPHETLAEEPPFAHAIVGARVQLQKRHLPGITEQLAARNVFALLRDDVRHAATVATLNQATALEGRSVGGKQAGWFDNAAERREADTVKQARIDAFRREWGYDPPEYA